MSASRLVNEQWDWCVEDRKDRDAATARLVGALGLVDDMPGRQIHRDSRGWKTYELQLERIVVGSVSPSFKQPLAFATALIDSRWRSAVLLDDRIAGPVDLIPDVSDTLINTWPPPAAWVQEGWITIDGTRIDLTLANLGAQATLSFNGGPSELRALYAGVMEIITQVARSTEDQTLDSWLNGAGLA